MKKNLFSFLLGFTLLTLNCISCSHSKPISADAGLTEGSDSGESASVSDEAEKKADDLVGQAEGAPLEATSAGVKLGEDPVLLGMESTMSPEDHMQVAQASIPENATPSLDSSVKEAATAPADSNFGALSNASKILRPAQKSEKKIEAAPAPKKAVAPVASNVDDPFADELNAAIPEREKPKLASAEIGSFIERHAFLVTLCAVGFVFGVFIFMRRKNGQDDHNLTI